MKITDEDRMNFLYLNLFDVELIEIKKGYHYKVNGKDGLFKSSSDIREAIDNAIMAMREKDK